MTISRQFSTTMQDINSSYLLSKSIPEATINIGFILLENFSMTAFTASVDVLVTANLVHAHQIFNITSYGLENTNVTSDLGIDIAATSVLSAIPFCDSDKLNILIVCGGLRCDLNSHTKLIQLLKKAHKHHCVLGGIWNGIVPLAQADVLHDSACALHIDNHPLVIERFPKVNLTQKSYICSDQHLSCADASSSLDMTLSLLEQLTDTASYRAVKNILVCGRSIEEGAEKLTQHGDNDQLPKTLRNAIELMNCNIEEPICIDEIAALINANRRQIERLFKQHLQTSPSKHYLEIRLTYARRLLVHTNDSITNIAIACGFLNSNHFSNCFKLYFKMPPSHCRKKRG